MENLKTCGSCKVSKDVAHFGKDKHAPDGMRYRCRACQAAKDRAGSDAGLIDEVTKGGAELAAFGLPIERVAAETLIECGSVATAAERLGCTPNVLRAQLSELRRRAAKRGYAEGVAHTKTPTPEGYHVKGVSTQVDADGNVISRWIKTNRDEEHKITALLDAMAGIADAWLDKADPVAAPVHCDDDLMCVYPMGDPHFGMYAWPEETGDSFDLDLAEKHLCTAVDQLVAGAPAAREALIINLGDFFHADNQSNQTSRSHHSLDVDTRWGKVMRVGIRTMRRCIDRALEKHERVKVICEIGNHDDHSSIMLALCLEQFYSRETRVTIDTSPSKFHWHRFGNTLIGVTHGDTVKMSKLPGVMAADQPQAWGESTYRHWYTGHVHHDELQEFPGCTVESFRTLAPRDAWHNAAGYRSGQDMKCDVFSRNHGRIQRNTIGIRAIKALNK